VTNWVTIALNNHELRRTPAHLVILVSSLNRTGYRSINIALQARGQRLKADTLQRTAPQLAGKHGRDHHGNHAKNDRCDNNDSLCGLSCMSILV
jgi:hypothetical protein